MREEVEVAAEYQKGCGSEQQQTGRFRSRKDVVKKRRTEREGSTVVIESQQVLKRWR
jgi:hypothetical protein